MAQVTLTITVEVDSLPKTQVEIEEFINDHHKPEKETLLDWTVYDGETGEELGVK